MGEVYRARDPRLNRHVAIKLLPVEFAADPHARERLRREAMAVAAIDHPYICKIFEIGEDGDALFLVMEYIAGETLHRRLQDGALPLSDALLVAGEIAEVLPFNLALVYLGLGDGARALDNLEQALAADSQMMPWIGRDAIFDPIRSEPRFVSLLNKMGASR
jgi:hypothetical protein